MVVLVFFLEDGVGNEFFLEMVLDLRFMLDMGVFGVGGGDVVFELLGVLGCCCCCCWFCGCCGVVCCDGGGGCGLGI